jgi:uncharacterized protein
MVQAVALALALVLAGALWRAASAFLIEWRTFRPRRGPVPLPAPPGGLSAVTFPSADGTSLRGWLLAPQNGAAVVFVHGSEADRRQLLPEARLVASHGYGALLFDMPGHGESGGVAHWSEEARAAVRGAAGFLASQPGLRPGALAAYGFSMGAYTVAQAAPDEPRLAAVVLAGAPTDGDELTRYEFRGWGPLTRWPALWADRLGGFVNEPRALARMPMLHQPVLLIAGGREPVVQAGMFERLAHAGGGPRVPLLLPNADHGGYLKADPAAFERSLLGFLDGHLGR